MVSCSFLLEDTETRWPWKPLSSPSFRTSMNEADLWKHGYSLSMGWTLPSPNPTPWEPFAWTLASWSTHCITQQWFPPLQALLHSWLCSFVTCWNQNTVSFFEAERSPGWPGSPHPLASAFPALAIYFKFCLSVSIFQKYCKTFKDK